jgi:hypothetical protein
MLRAIGRAAGWPAHALALALTGAASAHAGKADVVAARLVPDAGGTFRVEVTVRSDDKGWHKYADKWEVLAPDGRVLATRVLLHPHEYEQPFTRDLDGVAVPPGIAEVRIRAHDKVEGWGGAEITVKVPR